MANYTQVECNCCGVMTLWPAADSVKNGGKGGASKRNDYGFHNARCERCRKFCIHGHFRHAARQMSGDNTYRTRPHRGVEALLRKMGIDFESEHEEFRPYRLDIYLPEWHLAIEVDGPSHSPRKDAERDRTLHERYGVPTLRIRGAEGPAAKIQRANHIEEFLVHWAPSTAERRAKWRSEVIS